MSRENFVKEVRIVKAESFLGLTERVFEASSEGQTI